MNHVITITGDIPEHLATYWIGVLVGMGISYKIDPASPLYQSLKEYRKERNVQQKIREINPNTYVSLSGLHKDSVKVTLG